MTEDLNKDHQGLEEFPAQSWINQEIVSFSQFFSLLPSL